MLVVESVDLGLIELAIGARVLALAPRRREFGLVRRRLKCIVRRRLTPVFLDVVEHAAHGEERVFVSGDCLVDELAELAVEYLHMNVLLGRAIGTPSLDDLERGVDGAVDLRVPVGIDLVSRRVELDLRVIDERLDRAHVEFVRAEVLVAADCLLDFVVFGGGRADVISVLADGGQDFGSDLVLKSVGGGVVRLHSQPVEHVLGNVHLPQLRVRIGFRNFLRKFDLPQIFFDCSPADIQFTVLGFGEAKCDGDVGEFEVGGAVLIEEERHALRLYDPFTHFLSPL